MAVCGHPLGVRTKRVQTLRPSELIVEAKETLFLNKMVQSTSLPVFLHPAQPTLYNYECNSHYRRHRQTRGVTDQQATEKRCVIPDPGCDPQSPIHIGTKATQIVPISTFSKETWTGPNRCSRKLIL